MMNKTTSIALFLALQLPAATATAAPRTFYVDPATGADSNTGAAAATPWRTIKFAATKAAAVAQGGGGPVTVNLAAGVYSEGLFFGPAQSGTASAPITFRGSGSSSGTGAAPPRRTVLSGGLAIPGSAFKPAGVMGAMMGANSTSTHTAPQILTADLKALGVNLSDLGSLAPGSLGECSGDKMELVEDGVPMQLARWPNKNASNASPSPSGAGGYPGFSNWANARKVWGMGGGEPQAFTLLPNASDTTPPSCPGRAHAACPAFGPAVTTQQLRAWAKEEDLWMHGYWSNDYGDSYVKAAAVDVATGRINISRSTVRWQPRSAFGRFRCLLVIPPLPLLPVSNKRTTVRYPQPPCYPVITHARVMAVNARSELDQPGEVSRAQPSPAQQFCNLTAFPCVSLPFLAVQLF